MVRSMIAAVSVGIFHGFREDISEQFIFAGKSIAILLDRGYGLGSNLIIEGAYYGYFSMVITFLLIPILLWLLKKVIENSSLPIALSISAIVAILMRLVFREGIYPSLGALFLILPFYFYPVYLLNRFKFRRGHFQR